MSFFKKKKIFLSVGMCVHTCTYKDVLSAEGRKEPELQVVVSHLMLMLGATLGSCAKAASALNHRVSLQP